MIVCVHPIARAFDEPFGRWQLSLAEDAIAERAPGHLFGGTCRRTRSTSTPLRRGDGGRRRQIVLNCSNGCRHELQ
jgi:hypothetical protein